MLILRQDIAVHLPHVPVPCPLTVQVLSLKLTAQLLSVLRFRCSVSNQLHKLVVIQLPHLPV